MNNSVLIEKAISGTLSPSRSKPQLKSGLTLEKLKAFKQFCEANFKGVTLDAKGNRVNG